MNIYNKPKLNDELTYWEKVASTKWGNYISEIEKNAILKANNFFKEQTIALDIGSDGGRWSRILANFGWKVVCTDINESSLNICSKRIPTAVCVKVSEKEKMLPCASNSIQLIICIEVNPVIQSKWFIDEAYRVLKDNGLIVGLITNLLSVRGIYRNIISLIERRPCYNKVLYPFWRRKLFKCGFSMIHEKGCCWFPFRRDSNSAFVPFFVDLEKRLLLSKLISLSPWIVFIAKKIK